MIISPRPMNSISQSPVVEEPGVELTIKGVVQGVGFRPFTYRLASRFGYRGTISNSADGVVLRLAPPYARLDSFLRCLRDEAPSLASIASVETRQIDDFPLVPELVIQESDHTGRVNTMIPPDAAVCDDCLREMFSKKDRRYRYPFINCTNCGPRFTIAESIPYDRANTSMSVFPMCPACGREYHDPLDRRFHAQPNACPECGPELSWYDSRGTLINCDDPLSEAVNALSRGLIVAMRSLGGFHLVVDATNEQAVRTLRERKKRPAKPLAVMVADLREAMKICRISRSEMEELRSHRRPILLLRKNEDSPIAPSVTSGLPHLGLMLPYTPFHHLLFRAADTTRMLVMTSGNRGGEPICTANSEAMEKLADIADFFLFHNRDIVTRVDDSVLKFSNDKRRFIRRARGYVPGFVALDRDLPDILACGAELKNTFCMVREKTAWVSQHIGNLSSLETLEFFEESIRHMQDILRFTPDAIACDLHPDYLSTRFAESTGLPLYRVQHHHAHAAAIMAEHGLSEEVFAVILDGTGFGPDGTVWGGEILLAGFTSFLRLANIEEMMLPGGDAAAREPWRMALAVLWTAFGENGFRDWQHIVPVLKKIEHEKRTALVQMMSRRVNTPITSSCGRLFDAVAALLDYCLVSGYEGQAAMQLEAAAWQSVVGESIEHATADEPCLPVAINERANRMVIRIAPMIQTLVQSSSFLDNRSACALAFHRWLIQSVTSAIEQLASRHGRKNIVLGGGCMQNTLLLDGLTGSLRSAGFDVYTAEKIPANDGGLSLGQAMIAGMLHHRN